MILAFDTPLTLEERQAAWPAEPDPCPFCGSEDVELANTWTASYWVECLECGAEMHPKASVGGNTSVRYEENPDAHEVAKMHALSAWNRRVG